MCLEHLLSPSPPWGVAAWSTPARQRGGEGAELADEHRELLRHVVARVLRRTTPEQTPEPGATSEALGVRVETFAHGLDALCVFNALGTQTHVDTPTLVHGMLLWALLARGTPPRCVHAAMACWTVAGKCQNGFSITREHLIAELRGAWDWEAVQSLDWLPIRLCGGKRAAAVLDEVAVLRALDWDVGLRQTTHGPEGDVRVFDPVQIISDVFALHDPSLVAASPLAVAEHKAFARVHTAGDAQKQAFAGMLWRELTQVVAAALGVTLTQLPHVPITPHKRRQPRHTPRHTPRPETPETPGKRDQTAEKDQQGQQDPTDSPGALSAQDTPETPHLA
jgi:hypothetical protein